MAAGGIKRFIDFSTSEVFGRYAYNVTEWDATTLGAVGEARWTYAVAKLATEHLAMNYWKQYGLPTCSIRPFNIYGPRQVGEGAVHHFIVRALRGEPLHDPQRRRADPRLVLRRRHRRRRSCSALTRDEAVGHAFNIGNPRSTLTIYDLAREIVRLPPARASSIVPVESSADVELRIPNIDKARELLGYRPRVDLEEGLLRTIYWYRRHLDGSAQRRMSDVVLRADRPGQDLPPRTSCASGSRRSRTSPSRSSAARCSASSAPTARARPPR